MAQLWDGQGRDDLLLEMAGVAAVVEPASRRIAEVVADEACGWVAEAEPVRRIQLRVPCVLAQADVVPEWAESRVVELNAGVDAVVGGGVWRCAREVRVYEI